MEVWKSVKGFEGLYEVSDLGRVRTVGREVHRRYSSYQNVHTVNPMIRKLTIHSSGYVRISLCKKGVRSYHYVHNLVLTAFVGDKPEGMDADHKDKVRINNKLSNLRYLDIKSNRGIIGNKHAKK